MENYGDSAATLIGGGGGGAVRVAAPIFYNAYHLSTYHPTTATPTSYNYTLLKDEAALDLDPNHYQDSGHYPNLKSCESCSSGGGEVDSSGEEGQSQGKSQGHGHRDGVKAPNMEEIDENASAKSDKGAATLQDPKTCGVCGDKALGNNFNAITCESCKAFFRRNALRTKEFVCPFNDNCKVDPVTRRFCQKCRLKKCFDIGMKKEWIMTEEEKKIKKQKIEQNRLKRASSDVLEIDSQAKVKERVLSQRRQGQGLTSNTGLLHSDASSNSNSNDGVFSAHLQQPQPQPMMPHNSNTLYVNHTPSHRLSTTPTPLTDQNQNQGGGVPLLQELEHSTTPSVALRKGAAIEPGHAYTQDHLTAWNENAENVRREMPHNYYSENHTPTNTPIAVPPMSVDNNASQMPILVSLVRPGVSDSPPEVVGNIPLLAPQIHVQPPVLVEEYPKKKSLILQQYILEHQEQPPDLTPAPRHDDTFIEDLQEEVEAGDSPLSLRKEELPPLPLNTMESILSVAISAEFNAFGMMSDAPSTPTPSPMHSSRDLNKAEKAKLSELFYASDALNAPVDLDGPLKIETSDPSLINVINLTDIAIRRLIKMSKKICAFKNMCQEDQIALLKGGCTEMMILRSVVSYDPERDSWNIPHSNGLNLNLGVLKEARGNLYEEHQRFVKSFKPEWRVDYNIMIILCAITLFTPQRPNVIHKDVVKLEQDSYYYLLKRYLESTRNGCEARSTYLQLIQRIAELHILNCNHLRVFLEVNPREVEPLLIEIFDLKQ